VTPKLSGLLESKALASRVLKHSTGRGQVAWASWGAGQTRGCLSAASATHSGWPPVLRGRIDKGQRVPGQSFRPSNPVLLVPGAERVGRATTPRQLVLIMMGSEVLRNGRLHHVGQCGNDGVSLAANRCSQRVEQSPWVMKRHEQRGGTSTALPNKRSQATAGGRCSVNRRRRSPAAPEAQRYVD
jgi:hypothetical protein